MLKNVEKNENSMNNINGEIVIEQMEDMLRKITE